ncbi:NAD(P)H-dependent oxidoreductase [Paenibacillus sp. FSL M8-0228]|jgi:putative NADPH-quinone reductase|uniref:NAD(P)H-dependent oxidoreductase n=1 Tax=Paenibacillus TaxID=44249 RepID=UPI000413E4A8|nr:MULTISPECIES: NAD(P)H-dependent oxidoreductase [Paenibacillus]KEO77756.1 NADPH-quinone reductase [Paenibacillus polymyxa]MBO3286075.1 NAD(P)H-dependent oxidoreductase [Paenibacillus polymyxa]MBP1310777.1 putative NADPH-quinone reductase [Paenibacillus sp. 1182]MCH6189319.1 NAD(P)H-dependent oxidoreductase [Paenibacillus polymyxa]MDY8094314.1 NAD(P)H-dependent oxidoreductase [Paenibacillus polymyxa]
MSKKILVIQGNPVAGSYGEALAQSYVKGAKAAGAEVRLLQLSALDFNPNLLGGYRNKLPLEPDLIQAQESIKWAEHLVFVFPIWWGSLPALMKGFIDRTIMPGFAFKYQKGKSLPDKLLKGRTARLITTMDGPHWYYRFFQGQPGHRMMKDSTLHLCGVKPVRSTTIDLMNKLSDQQRNDWLSKVEQLGRSMS